MRLSDRDIRANILNYLRAEPEQHTRKRGVCVGCDHFEEHLVSVEPPLCDRCNKVHRGVQSTGRRCGGRSSAGSKSTGCW
jgi:hypothetical protein